MRKDYYERQQERGEAAARLIIIMWIFLSGAAAGWISHMVMS